LACTQSVKSLQRAFLCFCNRNQVVNDVDRLDSTVKRSLFGGFQQQGGVLVTQRDKRSTMTFSEQGLFGLKKLFTD
jgi:hypothetical protein